MRVRAIAHVVARPLAEHPPPMRNLPIQSRSVGCPGARTCGGTRLNRIGDWHFAESAEQRCAVHTRAVYTAWPLGQSTAIQASRSGHISLSDPRRLGTTSVVQPRSSRSGRSEVQRETARFDLLSVRVFWNNESLFVPLPITGVANKSTLLLSHRVPSSLLLDPSFDDSLARIPIVGRLDFLSLIPALVGVFSKCNEPHSWLR